MHARSHAVFLTRRKPAGVKGARLDADGNE